MYKSIGILKQKLHYYKCISRLAILEYSAIIIYGTSILNRILLFRNKKHNFQNLKFFLVNTINGVLRHVLNEIWNDTLTVLFVQ